MVNIFLSSPMPSGISMTHADLDRVQVRGTVGHVSAVMKWSGAAVLVSWTYMMPGWPDQQNMHVAVFIFGW